MAIKNRERVRTAAAIMGWQFESSKAETDKQDVFTRPVPNKNNTCQCVVVNYTSQDKFNSATKAEVSPGLGIRLGPTDMIHQWRGAKTDDVIGWLGLDP